MAKKYTNDKIPKPGSKIAYMLSAKDIHYAAVLRKQDLNNFNYDNVPDAPCYLTDYTLWRNVKIWWYENENYNYGKELNDKKR